MPKWNNESCSANRVEFKDQSEIKENFDQIGIRPIRLSNFGHSFWRAKRREREKKRRSRGKRRKRRGKVWKQFVYGYMDCYGFVWILVCSISRV